MIRTEIKLISFGKVSDLGVLASTAKCIPSPLNTVYVACDCLNEVRKGALVISTYQAECHPCIVHAP